MESTGVYWKPVFYVLEDAMECWLLNARHLRNVPGRKTDVADAAWIAGLVEHGLVRPSFVPPAPIRELRNLTRYRRAQIEERTREAQRLDKVLQDAGIKLSSVATDILGVSGRAMLDALVAGNRDPDVLADLALGLVASGETVFLHPAPQRGGTDAEIPSHLRDGLPGLPHDRHRPLTELGVVLPPL